MKNILLLFGGRSSEYEVSLSSATGAYNNIDKEKYAVHLIGITVRDASTIMPAILPILPQTNGRKAKSIRFPLIFPTDRYPTKKTARVYISVRMLFCP